MRQVEAGAKALLADYLARWCRGRSNAVQVPDLARNLGLAQRLVRKLAAEIATETGRVGSATQAPAGLFWCITRQEFIDAERSLMTRVEDLSRRAAAVRKAGRLSNQTQMAV